MRILIFCAVLYLRVFFDELSSVIFRHIPIRDYNTIVIIKYNIMITRIS